MLKRGVYAATVSVINKDYTLNVEATIAHAETLIKSGLHGVFFFGSTGQSQLVSHIEKKALISKIATNKLKQSFFLGTGTNSLNDNLDLIKYGLEFGFNTFLIMPPAYYKGNSDEGVYDFYKILIEKNPKVKVVLYNFEKLSGYKFNIEIVSKLRKNFPKNIIGCKDSSYNLFEKLKLKDFLMFPGSETKLLKGLQNGCDGCISAITNATHEISRKVFDDYEKKKEQTLNEKLIKVREAFDKHHLISAVHSYLGTQDDIFKNLLPPLKLLSDDKLKELINELKNLKF
ncbi:MAG: dihydrodipicolinate synthase family protein [Candidatus Pelagibacter sp.]|nr:dihydrodipicolinate synthase family protein [Candidatus Pelagibacter sp.]|tara:strand:- start:2499 stop:3359 length:861 start_codon:yes stop_codon:yes gene_type:complete